MVVDKGKRQCETPWAGEALPPKIPRQEKGPSGPSGSHQIAEGEKTGGRFGPLGHSMWNNHTFNAMDFSNCHMSL